MNNLHESTSEPSEPLVDLINMETAQIEARSEDTPDRIEAHAGPAAQDPHVHDDNGPVAEPAVEHTEAITDDLIHQPVRITEP